MLALSSPKLTRPAGAAIDAAAGPPRSDMRRRSVLLTLALLLSACAGTAAPFGLAATPTLSARERVEAQLRKQAGGAVAAAPGSGAASAASAGAPASLAGAPRQLPNTATAHAEAEATPGLDPVMQSGPAVWDGSHP